MRNSQDANLVTEFNKNHGIWETRKQGPTDRKIRRRIKETGKRCWASGDQHQRAFKLVEEFGR